MTGARPLLVLFDIDLTLMRSGGAGLEAMCLAGSEALGRRLERGGVDFAGRLDPLILSDLIAANGFEPTPERIDRLQAAYFKALPGVIAGRAEALPGAHALVDRLLREPGVTIGLLTGNFEVSGRIKLEAAGFDPDRFAVRVWGDDSPHDPPARDHLPPVAIERHRAATGAQPGETVIIGDTAHDVACALANGCRVLAVATGWTDAETLARAGAHRVSSDLSDTAGLAAWVLGESGERNGSPDAEP